MRNNPYQAYVESEVLTADPVKLVRLLYAGALEAISDARRHLQAGDIAARSAAITKAIEILAELSSALDHSKGGDLSARLAALYDYMQSRLVTANTDQVDGPLGEVQQLMSTLEDAWRSCEPGGSPAIIEDTPAPALTAAEYVPLSCAY